MGGPFEHLEPDEPPAHLPDRPSRGSRSAEPGRQARSGPSSGMRPGEPGVLRALVRGSARRCPRCGSGGLFRSRFRIHDRCPRCGLHLQREEGGFLGAMILSYSVTAAAWLALLTGWLIVDLPDLHVGALTVASIGVAALVPLLFWPFSKTIWASVDYLVYRAGPDYAAHEAADRSTGNGGRP